MVSGAWRTQAGGLVLTLPRGWSPFPVAPVHQDYGLSRASVWPSVCLWGPSWRVLVLPPRALSSLPLPLVFPLHSLVFPPFLLLTLLCKLQGWSRDL